MKKLKNKNIWIENLKLLIVAVILVIMIIKLLQT